MLKKILLWTIILIILLTAGTFLYFEFFDSDKNAVKVINKRMKSEELLSGRQNILIMGVDERSGDVGRSDTMMVAMIDPKTDQVAVLSIPRDTRVYIPDNGWDKINHAYAFGGHRLSQATVEDFLGIKIHHYVMIDFAGFKKVVDAIGGVDIYVEKRMYYEDPYDNLVIDIMPGMQHLNGEQAIHYVRYRDEEGDIGRVKRQQHFISAIYEKMLSPSTVKNLPALTKIATESVKTDMYSSNIVKIANTMKNALKQGLKTYSIPGEPEYIDGISYWIPNISTLRGEIATLQGGQSSEVYKRETMKLAEEYNKSIQEDKKELVKEEPSKSNDKTITIDKKKAATREQAAKATAPSKKEEPAKATVPDTANKETKVANPNLTRPLNVILIIGTERPEATQAVTSMLAEQNIRVSLVKKGELRDSTRVVSATSNPVVVDRLSRLPLSYTLRVANNDNVSADAIIYVGNNF